MACQFRRRPFGPYTLLTLGTDDDCVAFVPEASGYVHQIRLGGRDLLRNYADGEALRANFGHYNLALLPFPNRLRGGEYEWDGRPHRFPVNNEPTGSALHGYNHEARFGLTAVALGADAATARLSFLNHGADYPRYGYPFPVLFELAMRVDFATPTFTWRLSARNVGTEPVPVGLGWHPYFALPGGLGQWCLVMPANEQVELDGALPTGRLLEGLPPKQPLPIDPAWDSCFRLDDPSADATVELRGPQYSLSLKHAGDTRYTQLYVPEARDAVAVEPMTCGVDAFREARDEVTVAPGQTVATSLEVVYREDEGTVAEVV